MNDLASTTRIQGAGILGHAADLHEELVRAMAPGGAVTLDLSEVEGADISFVQLMASASLTAVRAGRSLTLEGLSPAHRVAFENAGIRFDPALGRIIPN